MRTRQENLFFDIKGLRVNTVSRVRNLIFLGRRQVATEFFFSVAIWKNVVAQKQKKKVSIKFFLRSETQTKSFGCQMDNSGRQFFF